MTAHQTAELDYPSIDEVVARFRARRAEVERAEAIARKLREEYDRDCEVFLGKLG
jgi:hypothetical protein